MTRRIDKLTEEQFNFYKRMMANLWLAGHDSDMDDGEKFSFYTTYQDFLQAVVDMYDIDDTRKWEISEATGMIYYLEEE